jgi:melanoma-associated antigen p97
VILISNFKYRRLCSSGVGKATGWVIPLNLMLDTQQIRVYGGHLIRAFSELVARACVPGILNNFYNPTGYNAINLCEICASGGDDRCQRDSRELYYGDAGAFRCLVENGDIAFARHTTVHDYTNGRHMIDWARDRRSHDYQLLCIEGGRAEINEWKTCNLGKIPGSTVVTSKSRGMDRRKNLWQLLQYAQEYYSSDDNPVFRLFDSGFGRQDLMFTDSATKLIWIDEDKQDYQVWLGRTFIRKVENILWLGNDGETGMYNEAPVIHSKSRITSSLITFLSVMFAYLIAM